MFTDLKSLCDLTDGNLSRHLTVLQEAELIELWKGYKGRRPQTLCRITSTGRRRFLAYVKQLEAVVADARTASRAGNRGRRPKPDGFTRA